MINPYEPAEIEKPETTSALEIPRKSLKEEALRGAMMGLKWASIIVGGLWIVFALFAVPSLILASPGQVTILEVVIGLGAMGLLVFVPVAFVAVLTGALLLSMNACWPDRKPDGDPFS